MQKLFVLPKQTENDVDAKAALESALEEVKLGKVTNIIIIAQSERDADTVTINGWSSTMTQDQIIGLMARYQNHLLCRSCGLLE